MKLGLVISEEKPLVPSLSRLHLTSLHHFLVPELLASWEDIITVEGGEEYIKGENDIFHFEKQESRWSLNSLSESLPLSATSPAKVLVANKKDDVVVDDRMVDYDAITKRIIPHESDWPGTKETPSFNHHSFYANLRKYQLESGGQTEDFGKNLLYGEVVTSTNTLLEKYALSSLILLQLMLTIDQRNPKLLSNVPEGFTVTATTQVAGRGRGSNVWVSPAGSLIFSVTMKHPMSHSNTAPVVFIQYLAAIAIVEGIQSYDVGYEDVPVKLKWPNDICKSHFPPKNPTNWIHRRPRPHQTQKKRVHQNRRHPSKLVLLLRFLRPRRRNRTQHHQRRSNNLLKRSSPLPSRPLHFGKTFSENPHQVRGYLQIFLSNGL